MLSTSLFTLWGLGRKPSPCWLGPVSGLCTVLPLRWSLQEEQVLGDSGATALQIALHPAWAQAAEVPSFPRSSPE